MIKRFINQGQEFSLYVWTEKNESFLLQGAMNKKAAFPVDHPWKISFTGNGTLPVKTGLGLKDDKKEFVILSTQIKTTKDQSGTFRPGLIDPQ